MAIWKGAVKSELQRGLLQAEMLFAWGTLLVSIVLATLVYAKFLASGYPAFPGILPAAILLVVLLGGAFSIRSRQRQRQVDRLTAGRHPQLEELLSALEKLSPDDRRNVIRRVVDEYEGRVDYRLDEERRIRLFGLYLLGCSIFLIAAINRGHAILTGGTAINPLLDVAILISAGVVVEMLLRGIGSARRRSAERLLKQLLGVDTKASD